MRVKVATLILSLVVGFATQAQAHPIAGYQTIFASNAYDEISGGIDMTISVVGGKFSFSEVSTVNVISFFAQVDPSTPLRGAINWEFRTGPLGPPSAEVVYGTVIASGSSVVSEVSLISTHSTPGWLTAVDYNVERLSFGIDNTLLGPGEYYLTLHNGPYQFSPSELTYYWDRHRSSTNPILWLGDPSSVLDTINVIDQQLIDDPLIYPETIWTGWSVMGGTRAFELGYLPTAPIPEPETYALMLAGLGVLGFVARRNKKLPAAC